MEKSNFTHSIVSERFTRLFTFLVIAIGLLVLIGWYAGLMFLTRFSINEVPMAPSTAYVFGYLAVGLWFYLRPQKIAINRTVSIASAVIVICLSCFLIITNLLKYYADWEHLFIKLPENHLNMPLGHMSLITALLFIISGFAFLFLHNNQKIVKTFSIILTLIIFVISFILLLGYAFDAPFFYFANFIPPAVLTVLSFLLVSLSLLGASHKNTFFVKTIWNTSTSARLLRIFLPTTIAITVIESLLIIRILPLLKIHPAIGVSLVSVIFVALVIVVISIISKSIGKALDSALENLNESEKFSKEIIEAMSDGFSILDESGVHIDVNLAFCKMTGFAKEELIGVGPPHPYWPEEEYENIQKAFVKTAQGNFENFELVFKNKNGKRFPVLVNPSQIKDDQGNVVSNFATVMDISRRKKLEFALKESEEQLRIITNNLPVLISQIDKDLKYTFANQYYYDLSLKQDEIVGKNVVDIIGEETYKRAYPQMQKALLGELVSFENTHRNKNNKLLILETHYIPYIVNDQVESFFVLAMDITERKLAEEALRESEEKLNLVINTSPIGICTADSSGNFSTTNPAYERMLGYSKEECRSLSFFDVTHPDDRPKNKKLFQSMFSLETTGFSIKKRYIRKDGTEIDVSVHAIGITNEEGKVRFGTAFVEDITERKHAEQKILEALEKLSNAEVIAKMGNWSWNPNTNKVQWSDNMCRLYGIEPSEFDPTFDYANRYTHPDDLDYVSKIIERLLTEKKSLPSAEYRILTPDNKTVWVEGSTKILFDEKGEISEVVGTTQDITERKQIQETILVKNKEMENYLYIASHDLRTPLVNIQGFGQRLKKQADSIKNLFADKTLEPEIRHQLSILTDEDIPKTLSYVLSSIDKMDTLINGLLQLSRTGRIDMNIQKVDMNTLFAKILKNLDFQIKEAQCEIHIHPLPACYGDAALLDQLFANIISNALKYADSERALEITVDAKKTYNKVVYTIRDTGKGIAQKHLDKIWDVFYRIDPRSSKTGEGIGLSLVKQIAEKHKGKVWTESEENKGSDFYIELNNRTFTEL